MRPVVPYYGGKACQATRIAALMPQARVYVEAYGGMASLMLAREPSRIEVYNDLDARLVNLFRVLRDPAGARMLREMITHTPLSLAEYARAWRLLEDAATPAVERAWALVVAAGQAFSARSGRRPGWQRSVAKSEPSRWRGRLAALDGIEHRLTRAQIECRDALEVIRTWDASWTLFYLDPPYAPSTRKPGTGYRHEMTEEQHRALVAALLGVQGAVALSGYRCEAYLPLERAGWKRDDWHAWAHAAGHTRLNGLKGKGAMKGRVERVESLWRNPQCLEMLVEERRAAASRPRRHPRGEGRAAASPASRARREGRVSS